MGLIIKQLNKNNMEKIIFNVISNDCENNKLNGDGKEYHQNGRTKYLGYFKNGQKDGFGILYDENGNIEYVGNWRNDKKLDNIQLK